MLDILRVTGFLSWLTLAALALSNILLSFFRGVNYSHLCLLFIFLPLCLPALGRVDFTPRTGAGMWPKFGQSEPL